MKKGVALFLTLLLIFSSPSLFSCAEKKKKFTDISFEFFDTVTTIIGYAKNKEEFNSMRDDIYFSLGEYHKLYDIYNSYDGMINLYDINRAEGATAVDSRIIDLLIYSKEMYDMTDGELNIAMGSVLSIWHTYREEAQHSPDKAKIPSIEELGNAAMHTDIDTVLVNKESQTVQRTDTEVKLDVGAVAKGYAVEMIAKELEARGISGYLLNVGGNVRALGTKADGELWKLGIENPDTEDTKKDYIAHLEINGMSLVTSGSYQRYYEVNGKRYHHIIDKDTLMPGEYYLSVSVLTKDSALADCLSTALFSMPTDKGLALIESLPEVEAMWETTEKEIIFSSGFEKYKSK